MKKKEVVKILEENKLTNITPMDFKEAADKEQKELDESMKESFRQRDERKAKEDNLKEMAKQWPEYTLEELKKEQALADYTEKFKTKEYNLGNVDFLKEGKYILCSKCLDNTPHIPAWGICQRCGIQYTTSLKV